MSRWTIATHILLVGLALASEVVILTMDPGPLRAAAAMWLILVAPGWAVLRLIDLPIGLLAGLATAVGISVSISILLALALLYVRLWSVELAVTVLLAMVVTLVLADLPVAGRAVQRWRAAATREEAQ